MRIAVIGTGHVGLVVGTGLADTGHYVSCVDLDTDKIACLQRGELPVYEPGLEELVARNVEEERLKFTTDVSQAIRDALLVFICVGTPSTAHGDADLSQVYDAIDKIADAMPGYRIIVNKSTCPVGTTEALKLRLSQKTKQPFDVVVNPEFLRQGAAVDDFMRPDRIVVGCEDVRVEEIMKELYAPFLRTGKPLLLMSIRSAEMSKYAVNAMLAARISLMNEFANLCEAYGADINEVREGIAADSRIGPSYIFPGIGFGGSCLPKDLVACSHLAAAKGLKAHVLDAVTTVNVDQQTRFVETILAYYGHCVAGKRIALWGVSFKPKTDDLREGPALRVIDALLEGGAEVVVYDPAADANIHKHYGDRVRVVTKTYLALEQADGLVITTEWNEFRRPDYERMASLMREKVIFDGRNLYTTKTLREHGFRYFSIGRASV
ncbi:MAG: UDP-glucose/GDP-mannose dehydrogenase family protein [Candidatus Hydrogenedentes bacterium]|nr:UDP-glucose/GDP-mannose dehydrogenase family protein [Candidatus Hydrogenedentota bacterium]